MRERLIDIASFLHIEHLLDRNIFNLSGGEKQMIAIASALASDTDIILFDEPTSNLDVFYIEKIAQVLRKLKAAGKTIIISEHRLYFLKDIIDRALILKDGKIAHSLSAAEFAGLTEKDAKNFCCARLRSTAAFLGGSFRPPVFTIAPIQAANRLPVIVPRNPHNGHKCCISNNFLPFSERKNPVVAVENLSLGFGNITALVGKSGQGKSTFVHCLAGLTNPNKEAVYIGEKTVRSKASCPFLSCYAGRRLSAVYRKRRRRNCARKQTQPCA